LQDHDIAEDALPSSAGIQFLGPVLLDDADTKEHSATIQGEDQSE